MERKEATYIGSTAVAQTVACAPIMQWARVRSPVGTSFLGEVFSGFFSPVGQMSGRFGPPRSPNFIWPSLSSIIIHSGCQWPEMLTRSKTSNIHTHTTYIGNGNYLIYYISKYTEISEIWRVYHTLHMQIHPVITQFLQPEAEQLLLFRILLASVVLRYLQLSFLNVQPRTLAVTGFNQTRSIDKKSRFYYVVLMFATYSAKF